MKPIGSQEEFDQVLAEAGQKLVVVDFYASWCGPCKMMGPKVEKMAEEFKDVLFVKIDVDDQGCGDIVDSYDVNVMPTLLFIKEKKLLEKLEGNVPEKVREAVNKYK